MADGYIWKDNPTVSGVSECDTDVLNDCLMHLKYIHKGNASNYVGQLIQAVLPIENEFGQTPQEIHLTDGAIISQDGEYSEFSLYLKSLMHKYPQVGCEETEWQQIKEIYGECPRFVVDDTARTIRLPLIKTLIQGVTSVSQLGEIINKKVQLLSAPDVISDNVFDIQSIKAVYYIVISTGVNQNIRAVSDIEVNDVYPLLYPLLSDKLINSPCWIYSDGQWNDGETYPFIWNYLTSQYYEGEEKTDTYSFSDGLELEINYKLGVDLIKIADSSYFPQIEELENARYYVLDVEKKRFRLPINHLKENEFLYFKAGNAVQNAQLVNVGRMEGKVAGLETLKGNINADNFSNEGKTVIVNWGVPDWAKKNSFAYNTRFMADKNGFVINGTNARGTHIVGMTINECYFRMSSYDNNPFISGVMCFPVAIGDTYLVGDTSDYRYFVPLKGGV